MNHIETSTCRCKWKVWNKFLAISSIGATITSKVIGIKSCFQHMLSVFSFCVALGTSAFKVLQKSGNDILFAPQNLSQETIFLATTMDPFLTNTHSWLASQIKSFTSRQRTTGADLRGGCRGCPPLKMKPYSLYSLLKFVHFTSQLHHSLRSAHTSGLVAATCPLHVVCTH